MKVKRVIGEILDHVKAMTLEILLRKLNNGKEVLGWA
jgi:hypothetical protein